MAEAVASAIAYEGHQRADALLSGAVDAARREGCRVPFAFNTAYINTISVDREPPHPGDREIENRIRSAIRWNALVMVLRANKESSELAGILAIFQSAATLYDTGFMHFWHAPDDEHGGDLIFVQATHRPVSMREPFLRAA